MHPRHRSRPTGALPLVTCLLLAACGGSGDGSDPESGTDIDVAEAEPTGSGDRDVGAGEGDDLVEADDVGGADGGQGDGPEGGPSGDDADDGDGDGDEARDDEGGDPGSSGDPTVDGDGASANFRDALVGVRTYGCEPGDPGSYTTEFVEVFTEDGITTSDVWLYEEPECVTRPLTFSRALEILEWTLEEPVVTADGREAYGIRYEVLQRGDDGEPFGPPVGTVAHDLIALEDGGVSEGATAADTPQGRTDELTGPFPAEPLGRIAAAASREALQGTWLADCFNGKIQQRAFDDQDFVETVRYFADVGCAEESFYAETIKTWAATYGEPTVTVFGQPVMRTTMERVDARYGDLVIDPALPDPPPLGENGAVFEDIWGVVAGELVIGTCLDKRPEGCGVGENVPDILNFNVGNRYVRR